jgi:hydrogenase maturation protein HypF
MTQSHPLLGYSIHVAGLVQGVGFRPHVWQLAQRCQLKGTVANNGAGVEIEVWGTEAQLQQFVQLLQQEIPPLARIDNIRIQTPFTNPCTWTDFRIIASQATHIQTGIVPDAATCPACRAELFEPTNRRYRYAFINCTHCGPRLSIIQGIPYDRAQTSMARFAQCPACLAEYENPADRRFHAQPNACPSCGPQLWLENMAGEIIPLQADERDAIDAVNHRLKQGAIVGLMGLGGVHLVCDASNSEAVRQLRARKRRYAKPLALMARDIAVIEHYCQTNAACLTLLKSVAAPIVLLERKPVSLPLADELAPKQNHLGFMLPYTPLHLLLMQDWTTPLVMTSANVSDEPQCISLDETRQHLQGIADYLVLHNRPIVNRLDDSVLRVVQQQTRMIRRARGYAPSPFLLPKGFAKPDLSLLAMGGELKSTFALLNAEQVIVSQHLGDLENAKAWQAYEASLNLYQTLWQHQADAIVIDAHPHYRSSQLGKQLAQTQHKPLIEVQHHHAHLAACLIEHAWQPNQGKVLGIILDGLGYGADGTFWGGEFLLADYKSYERVAHLQALPMPGGTQAILQPWRNTWAYLQSLGWELIADTFQDLELIQFLKQQPLATLEQMLTRQINSPLSSSCGRLFDAVAAALNCSRSQISYEGQAAIELEAITPPILLDYVAGYPFQLNTQSHPAVLDAAPMWLALLQDLQHGYDAGTIAAQFHQGLIYSLVDTTLYLKQQYPEIQAVVLSGGVLQNRIMLSKLSSHLSKHGLQVLSPSQFPSNDGALSLGQIAIACQQLV